MIAANGRHGAFVLIYKRLQRQACFCPLQVPYQVAGLLDGWLHHLRVSFGILLRNHKGRIPDSENIGILRKTVISVHLQAVSRSIGIGRQSLKAVCLDTGHPEYIFGIDGSPVIQCQLIILVSHHPLVQFDFHITLLQIIGHFFGRLF